MLDEPYMGTALMREEDKVYTLINLMGGDENNCESFGSEIEKHYDIEEVVRTRFPNDNEELSSVSYVVEGDVTDRALDEVEVETGARKRHSDKPIKANLEEMAARVISTGMARMLDLGEEGIRNHEYESTDYSENMTPEVRGSKTVSAAGGRAVPAENKYVGMKMKDGEWKLRELGEVMGEVSSEKRYREWDKNGVWFG